MTEQTKEVGEPLLQAVGLRIRQLRMESGHSQQSFSEAAGMSNNYAWRVEAGRQNLNLKTLSRIAFALGISMSDLLNGIDADPKTIGTRPYQKVAQKNSAKADD
ncbi:helix-turn-helix domain-containing protein [Puniceibacterium sp. IMCC21224]|uniref:helix-turn-helix domain-containing protein n=1 Tax=Puniceibacterium sp. IMCC21224 TaxID=1618204 RepID=UPI0009E2EF79|nr:helix-turn-helix transcriptional regulator [Puniceibacterium sp. IMCC21224]